MTFDTSRDLGDRLALLYQLSQTFNSSLDLDEVLNRVLDEVIRVTRAERGFVMLKEKTLDGSEHLVFRVARGLDQTTIDDPQFQVSRSIVERVANEGQAVLTSDAQTDERFNIRQSIMILGLRSILCVPLIVKDKVLGTIYVDNRLRAGIFTQADLDLLSSIASSAAIAIENARLYQVAVEKGRMEREMQMARKVQSSLLPQTTPAAPGWEFTSRWRPARQVGGDYYDFIQNRPNQVGLVIADVTDKGMPAALFMAFTRTVVRASLDQASSPAEGIARANRLICADSTDSLFVTLFYGLIDLDTGLLTYVNAGHHPAFLYQKEHNSLTLLSSTGIALGVDSDSEYRQKTISMGPGDFVVLYTDGVTDAMNLSGAEFGMQTLQQNLLAGAQLPADELVSSLENAIQTFTSNTAPFDDITIVAARRQVDQP